MQESEDGRLENNTALFEMPVVRGPIAIWAAAIPCEPRFEHSTSCVKFGRHPRPKFFVSHKDVTLERGGINYPSGTQTAVLLQLLGHITGD